MQIRVQGKKIQCIRSEYDPEIKRSRQKVVAAIDRWTDKMPSAGLDALTDDERAQLSAWLDQKRAEKAEESTAVTLRTLDWSVSRLAGAVERGGEEGLTPEVAARTWEQIALLSSVFTLLPGDLISTGTPPGAAQQQPDPRWLRIGDRVRVAIDGLGELDNAVAEGSTATEIEPPAPWPAAPWPVAPWPVEPTGRTRP